MNIRRFTCPTEGEALEEIRTELGEDTIILSNRKTEAGVEIHAMENDDMEDIAPMKNDQTGNHARANLVVAISSRALFNLDESHAVFENEGIEAY
jgi:flagellar biosynthesis GTPase FlhF